MSALTSPTLLLFCDNLFIQTRIESVFEKNGFQVVIPGEKLTIPEATVAILEIDESNKWVTEMARLSDSWPGLPVICFGPHVNREALNSAKTGGAKLVLPRSKFMSELSDLPALVRSW